MIDLTTLPTHMKRLAVVDYRGYGPVPVPWFVAWTDATGHAVDAGAPGAVPEFRAMDQRRFVQAIKDRRCWVCGEPLGRWLAFPIGPMCALTRTTSEPPSHLDCAEWSLRHCPFLSNPQMVRRTEQVPANAQEPAGFMLARNPGVLCLWITRTYDTFRDHNRRALLTVGKPERVSWWCEGRPATRAEVEASIDGGVPSLLVLAKQDGPFAVEQLGKQRAAVEAMFPTA